LLEKKIVEMSFWYCTDLKDYFFAAIDSLSLGIWDTQWKKDKLSKAKDIVRNTKEFESKGMPYSAEEEIKKLIPSV
jgi:hypothetical protein